MSNFLKYSQLAKALGVSNASISMAIKNSKLQPENKRIDIELPINKVWIEAQESNGREFDLNKIYKPADEKPKVIQSDNTDKKEKPEESKKANTLDELRRLDVKKKRADLKKTEKETEKLTIQIDKLEGQLIPTDAVNTVFIYAAETFRTTYIQEINGLANIFVERLGGEHKHFIELQRELTEKVDEIQKMVKDHLLTGLKGIVSEYKEVRGRGESK